MLTPQYQQLEAILWFLKTALNGDPLLTRFIEPRVVSATAEFDPFEIAQNDEGAPVLTLYTTELPMLAVWEEDSEDIFPGGFQGERCMLKYAYAFEAPVGSADVPQRAWGRRVAKTVRTRIARWLQVHRFKDAALGTTWDLLEQGGIESIYPVSAETIDGGRYMGVTGSIEMTHLFEPYEKLDPVALDTVEIDIHPGDDLSTALVEGDYSV